MKIQCDFFKKLLVVTVLQNFTRERGGERVKTLAKIGIPIGNLTSQLFANVYMNEFDQFVKHILKIKFYARYTDDFVIVADDRKYLETILPLLENFLFEQLRLLLHPNKISISSHSAGIDFLGQIVFPRHRILRVKTKRRIWKKLKIKAELCRAGIISKESAYQSLQSYLGVLSHTNAYELSEDLKNQFWFWSGSGF